MADKFKRNDCVTHKVTGDTYVVVLGPQDGVTLVNTAEPAYVYQHLFRSEDHRLWVRAATSMEDGRFTFKSATTHAAEGRTP